MKTVPILFSGPMVGAIMAGQKTQTRRVLWTPKPASPIIVHVGNAYPSDAGEGLIPLRWGVGDVLWVRESIRWDKAAETWRYAADSRSVEAQVHNYLTQLQEQNAAARGKPVAFKSIPSIHMPLVACRTRLRVTALKIEPLHNISNEDIVAEGILPLGPEEDPRSLKDEFRQLWISVNGKISWELNPWVVAISFERV